MNDTNNAPNGGMKAEGAVARRPKLAFYHANAKGTGCALKLERRPASAEAEGCFMATIANQMTVGDRRAPNPVYPRFDWEGAIAFKLGFSDVCKMLQVLRGECESLEDGHGVYHRSARAATKIILRHSVETSSYSFEVYRAPVGGGDDSRAHIQLSQAEALGLERVFADSLALICFGVPDPDDRPVAAAWRTKSGEAGDGVAA